MDNKMNENHGLEQLPAAELSQEEGKKLLFRVKGGWERIKADEIYYLESQGRCLLVHLENDVREIPGSLSSYLPQLDERFCRCHQSFVVNLDNVQRWQRDSFLLNNDVSVSISQSHRKVSREDFLRHNGYPLDEQKTKGETHK